MPAEGVLTSPTNHATDLAEDAAAHGVVSVAVVGNGLLRAVASGAASGSTRRDHHVSDHLSPELDGVPNDLTGSGVAIANSGFYGAGVRVAPMADGHDGLLDVVMFEQTTRRSRTAAMIAMTSGRHFNRSDVRHHLARTIRVTAEPAMESYSDGYPMCLTPFTATVLQGAIGLLRPMRPADRPK